MIKIGNFMGDDPQAPKFIIIKRILNPDTVPFWDLINPENLPEGQVVIGQAGQISMGDGTYFQNQFFCSGEPTGNQGLLGSCWSIR